MANQISKSLNRGGYMKPNHNLSRTVAAILGASGLHAALAADATANPSGTSGQLQEVIVTAQRRTENIQDVPIAIQALTGTTLGELHVHTLSDYLKYVPNVSTGSLGPGNDVVYMRGLSLGSPGSDAQGSVGAFPNVAMYLDDEPTQLPGRNLDVYAVDLQRIEILEGPQGTLFGAGAQSGVIRYITNKPQLDTISVDVNAGYGTTAHGDQNSNVDATLNLPLVEDTLAVRLVVYTDSRGGYIDNLPATFSHGKSDLGIAAANGGVVPTNSVTINNYQIAANNINPLTYNGVRGSLLWKVNDDWDVLIEQSYQDMNAQGVFYEMPRGTEGAGLSPTGVPIGGQPLPPLAVNLFEPSFVKDRFENTALTVDGKVGPLSLVYAGSYLDRHVEQMQDYTNYARGRYGYYYQCTGVTYSSTSGNANATCYSPAGVWSDTERNTHLTQELRVSTPNDWRLRGIVGLFYEDEKLYDDTQFLYVSVPDCSPGGATFNCFLPVQTRPGETANDPNVRNAATAFVDDFQRTFIQKAAYGSVSYDIIPRVLTVTAGLRYFDMYNESLGGDLSSFGCKQFAPTSYFGPCLTPAGTSLDAQNPHRQVSTGHLGRANLSWHVTPDALVYYTYSQGYRPGGFNHGSTAQLPDANLIPQYNTPLSYVSDLVTNNEAGWKILWFDHRLQFDGALYQERWDNAQTQVFCPQCGLGNVIFITNGPTYQVKGVELQLAARIVSGLTVQGSAAWNSGELVNSPALVDNNPASQGFGKPITTRYVNGVAEPIQNVFGIPGRPLANNPPFQANLRARYDWVMGAYLPFVQVGFQHQAHSQSQTGFVNSFTMPQWTTYDASLGVSKDDWTVSLVGTNLTDVNKSLFTTASLFTLTETPMRPRVIELTFNYNFSKHD
jgi:iron complex outermembrane recepter protein